MWHAQIKLTSLWSMFSGIVKGTMTTTHSYTGDQVQDRSTTSFDYAFVIIWQWFTCLSLKGKMEEVVGSTTLPANKTKN